SLLLHLVHFDYVAFRVVEEDLRPTLHRPRTVVGKGNALLLEPALERLDVVRAKSYVPPLDRIDRLARTEADAEILLSQMELRGAVAQEGDLARIAVLVEDAPGLQRALRLQVEHVAVECLETGHILRANVHMMQLDFHIGRSARVSAAI